MPVAIQDLASSSMPEIPLTVPAVAQHRGFDTSICAPRCGPDGVRPRTTLWDNGDIYEGTWNEAGEMHGYGVYRWVDGSIYDGQWMDNQQNGIGTYVGADGSELEGEWHHGRLHGAARITSQAMGLSYFGLVNNGCRDGQGTLVSGADNVVHEGAWVEDKADGMGRRLVAKHGKVLVLDGEWRRGICLSLGSKYEGQIA